MQKSLLTDHPEQACFCMQVAFVGFGIQAIVTEQGPIANLQSHLSAPFENNIIGSIQNLPKVIGKGAL